jgi:hypothetical protein
MIIRFFKHPITIFIIIWLLFMISRNYLEKQFIKNNVITNGVIYKIRKGGKSGTIRLYYKYVIENKTYTNDNSYYSRLSYDDAQNYFVSKSFPVAYYPKFVYISDALIFPGNFSYLNLPFPDSLKWVNQYYNDLD